MNDHNAISENFVESKDTPKKSVALDEPVIVCPLDKSHRIPFSEIQCHLERCLIGDLIERTCPRNPQHILDEASYDHHVQHCQDTSITEPDRPTES